MGSFNFIHRFVGSLYNSLQIIKADIRYKDGQYGASYADKRKRED
jgi:hypothetical protein